MTAPDEPLVGADGVERSAARADLDALTLRRASVTFDAIATQLGFANADAARRGFERALAGTRPEYVEALEADRLDRLNAAVWPAATRGDVKAVGLALDISARRERLLRKPKRNKHELRTAFETSSQAAPTTLADAALVAAGLKVADRVDEALASGDGPEVTKALYLVPHLVNILREMQATPTSRLQGRPSGPAGTGRKPSALGLLRGAESARQSDAG